MKIRKNYWIIFVLTVLIIFSVTAAAQILIPLSEKAIEHTKAYENSPIIKKSGEKLVLTPPGLEKKTFIHYVKPSSECGNGICEPGEKKICPGDCEIQTGENLCYIFLESKVKWIESPINYIINPLNLDGLSVDFIVEAVSSGAEEWDSYVEGSLFDSYTVDFSATLDINGPDGKNEILFGYYPEEGVIAVTVVWGYFTGPPPTRKIIEFDILFNITYIWGDASLNPTIMDLQNIVTHELGHGIGLADLYETACSEETMYGYSIEGEMNKRDLKYGDISGIQELYGKL